MADTDTTFKIILPALRTAMGMRKTRRKSPAISITWRTVRWHGPQNEWKWEKIDQDRLVRTM